VFGELRAQLQYVVACLYSCWYILCAARSWTKVGWIVRLLIFAVCALTFCLLTTGAWADSVPILNSTFETTFTLTPNCAGTGCAFNFAIPDWNNISSNTAAGSFQPGSNTLYFTSPLPSGNIVAFINGGGITQTLGVSVLPDATYTLSVDVGRRVDFSGVNYSLNLYDGTVSNVFCSTPAGSNNSSIAAGTFAVVTLTCTTGSSVSPGLLGIELTGSGTQVNFDNVQLNVSSVSTPEPGTLAFTVVGLFVGGLLFLRSRRNQYLESASS
jgi:hypothetical protein